MEGLEGWCYAIQNFKGGRVIKTYSTSQIAKEVHVHPNTVRLYEEWGFISPVQRLENGYRCYTDLHVCQMKVARAAFRSEIIQGHLRAKARAIVEATGQEEYPMAYKLAEDYLACLQVEHARALEAAQLVHQWVHGTATSSVDECRYTRKQAAAKLEVSVDVVRNWERNGLIEVPRMENGYRMYSGVEIDRMKIIRTLRSAHFSMAAILRLFLALDQGGQTDILSVLNTPRADEDIVTLTDRLIVSLEEAMKNAREVLDLLAMK